jgi:hypothetical protein
MSKVATSMSVAVAATDRLIWSSFGETWISVFFFKEILRMTKILPHAALVAMPFKTRLKFLVKQAAISLAILLILVEIGSPLGAAQGAPNPAGFDILGMKLGMSVAQIEAAIKAYDPTLTINITQEAITDQRVGVGKLVQSVHAVHRSTGPFDQETIVVGFTVTQPSRAFYIGRNKSFSPEQRPLLDKTLQQFKEKYGPESRSFRNYGEGSKRFEWVFDKAGKQLMDSGLLQFLICTHANTNGTFSYGRGFSFAAPLTYSPECGTDLALRPDPSNSGLLMSLHEELVGDSIAADDIQKLMADAKATQEQQRKQQEQKASGVKPVL